MLIIDYDFIQFVFFKSMQYTNTHTFHWQQFLLLIFDIVPNRLKAKGRYQFLRSYIYLLLQAQEWEKCLQIASVNKPLLDLFLLMEGLTTSELINFSS